MPGNASHGCQLGACTPVVSRIPSASCTMANSVAIVPDNDANTYLASSVFAVTLRDLFGGPLFASAAPA
tara:strand:+ start:357 stop:563 length:207 start_codon:yes stop_codon:yes gene_type:complete